MPNQATLGQFIRQRRVELGMTQEEFATLLGEGKRQSEVSRLERDRIGLPRRERLERIAEALDVSVGDLLVRSGWAGADRALAATAAQEPAAESTAVEREQLPSDVRQGGDDITRLRTAVRRARLQCLNTERLLLRISGSQ